MSLLRIFFITLILFTALLTEAARADLVAKAREMLQRHGSPSSPTVAVVTDNTGDQSLHGRLGGTRNVKIAIPGVLYWGGREYPHKGFDQRRPLTERALKNLCSEGFSEAIYLYSMNWGEGRPVVQCDGANLIRYSWRNVWQPQNIEPAMRKIADVINGNGSVGPLYVHCWNGLHASNMLASLALRQFCNWSADKAWSHWQINAKGTHQAQTASMRAMITGFQPRPLNEYLNETGVAVISQICF